MSSEIVNIHAAKTNLSRLVERVEAGEEIIIGRAGKPVAKLVRYERVAPKRVPGRLKGQIRFLAGYDEADAEIERMFEVSIDSGPE